MSEWRLQWLRRHGWRVHRILRWLGDHRWFDWDGWAIDVMYWMEHKGVCCDKHRKGAPADG